MKCHLIALMLTVISLPAFCQDESINDIVNPSIQSGNYAKAWKDASDYLVKNPKSIAAHIAQGNIILNRYLSGQAQIDLSSNMDESIYEESIGAISERPVILPAAVADSISGCFLKGLEVDKTRKDIYFGVCTVYSYALQVDKLNSFLPTVIKNIPADDDMAYSLADYAIGFGKRGDFEDEMKVYNKIAELFPNSAGIMGDIAVQYQQHGDIKKAKEHIDLAMKRQGADNLTYRNAFTINAILENYDEAIKMAHSMDDNSGAFYESLVMLCRGGDWKTALKKWYSTNSNSGAPTQLAKQLLSDNFSNVKATVDTLMHVDLTDAYKIPVYKYFKEHSPYFMPAFKYAESLTYNSRYADAVKAFKEIKTDTITAKEKEELDFYMAWALYKTGNKKEANTHWEPLLKSADFYRKSAAAYFIGKSYLDNKDKTTANKYFSMVSDSGSKSKYANYCANLVKSN